MNSIFNDYISKNEKATSLFSYSADIDGINEKIREIQYKVASPELCKYLKEYNSSLACGPKTLANISKLSQGAKVIMTGQQCGLLGGPMYSIYKALTAIKLAQEVSQANQEVVPVFWIADEDHDWQEINHANFLDQQSNPKKFKINKDVKDVPAYAIENDKNTLEDAISFLKDLGLNTEYLSPVEKDIEDTYDENYSIWFAKIMTHLLTEHGLIFIDSKAPIIKEQGKLAFNQMLENRDHVMDIMSKSSKTIQEAGYYLQNPFVSEEETNLFLLKNGFRYKLKNTLFGMTTKKGEQFNLPELKDCVNNLCLSPNVFLRPIIQDYSFPTIAYVGGPGEINYMAQITDMYQYLVNEKLPVIFPRQSFMIIEPSVNKILKRYTLDYPHIHSIELLKQEFIHNDQWSNIDSDFKCLKNQIIHQYNQLIDKISTVNPQLSTIGDKNLQLILKQIEFLHTKTFNFHRENNGLFIKHMEKLRNNCYPRGIEQQRTINIFYFLVKYHRVFLDKVIEHIEINNFEMKYIEM